MVHNVKMQVSMTPQLRVATRVTSYYVRLMLAHESLPTGKLHSSDVAVFNAVSPTLSATHRRCHQVSTSRIKVPPCPKYSGLRTQWLGVKSVVWSQFARRFERFSRLEC